jgi:hypothetical protein
MSLAYAQIGEELGISTSTAFERVQRGMQAVPTEGIIEARRLELAKLNNIERRLLVVLGQRQPRVDHGRVIWDVDPGTGKRVRLLDYGPVVQAAAGMLRVQERRATLLGLDAPAQIRVETITEDMLDQEIRRFSEKHRLDHFEPVDDCSICRLIASAPVGDLKRKADAEHLFREVEIDVELLMGEHGRTTLLIHLGLLVAGLR